MRLLSYLQSFETPRSPRVHSNGFIQIDLSKRIHLHVWCHCDIPAQATNSSIHDHVWGFQSRVLIGTLNQRTLSIRPASSGEALYQPHNAVPTGGDNTVLRPFGGTVQLSSETSVYVTAGDLPDSMYAMAPYVFHESIPLSPAVSIIVKQPRDHDLPLPRVLVPCGLAPGNDFDRHAIPQGLLWDLIGDVIRRDETSVALGILWARDLEAEQQK